MALFTRKRHLPQSSGCYGSSVSVCQRCGKRYPQSRQHNDHCECHSRQSALCEHHSTLSDHQCCYNNPSYLRFESQHMPVLILGLFGSSTQYIFPTAVQYVSSSFVLPVAIIPSRLVPRCGLPFGLWVQTRNGPTGGKSMSLKPLTL